jgi:hypothetical protein
MNQSKQQAGIGIAKGFGPHVSLCNWDSYHVCVVSYSSSYIVERGSVPYIVVGDLLFSVEV